MDRSRTTLPAATAVPASFARLLAFATCCLAALVSAPVRAQESAEVGGDGAIRAALTHAAERVLLPDRCGECHAAEFEVWEATEHATGFDTLHRSERAKEIYRSLGLRLIKRGTDETTPSCLNCHYTPVLRRGQLRAGAGVTCESCHGAARDWIALHNNYGVAESDFQEAGRQETAAHRAQRIADSTAAGMRRPSQIYDVAANCFGCHTVPNQELVNRAGHSTGSDFELVEWSGRIRHNFLQSYKTADGRTNAEPSRTRKRIMYVVGRALDLEYALRGVAVATEDDLYVAAMSDRAGAALDELFAINDRLDIPAVQTIIAISESVEPTLDNRAALLAAADAVQEATRAFISGADGNALAPIDPLWDPDLEETSPPARVVTDAAIVPDSPPLIGDDPAPPGAPAAEGIEASAGAGANRPAEPDAIGAADAAPVQGRPPAPAPPPLVTLTRPPWRDPPAHDFVKVPCGRCHNAQEKWWRRDPHSQTAAPLRNGEERALEIARAYGVAADDLARGTQTCMWCHGTIVSNPSRKVRAGVGCQRCHGPGADYLEPHETTGHAESVALGLTDLHDPEVQAATCAGCHYVTDPGLIDAGHPVGADFDILARTEQIVHWGDAFGRDALRRDSNALAEAHARVLADRGPVAERSPGASRTPTAPARPPAQDEGRAGTSVPTADVVSSPAARESERPAAAATRPPRSGPPRDRVQSAPTLIDAPELGDLAVDDASSVEETMESLRRRIEELYRALGRVGR